MELFTHLTVSAQKMIQLTDEERIHKILSDRWIGYPTATKYLQRLEDLFHSPSKQRMPNLLIIGQTNNGKSMIVEKFKRMHQPVSNDEYEYIPVLAIQMPSDPSIIRFYTAILAGLGAPFLIKSRLVDIEQQTLRILKLVGVKILIIDELHNILSGNGKVQREFLNVLRFLGNELRISLVGVGIKDAYLAIQSDRQLENRFEPMVLPTWQVNSDTCSLLASFASSFPLKKASYIATMEMAQYCLARSEGTIGELASLLTSAAIEAVKSGEEAINENTLKASSYIGPTLRRRQFEREIL